MGRSQPRPPARTPAPGFPSTPAHVRPRTHARTEQRACLHQEKLCLELKLACVNYSDNDFARYIWAGPPCPFPAAHPPLWAAGPSPHPPPAPAARVGSRSHSHFPASLAPKCILNITLRRDNY